MEHVEQAHDLADPAAHDGQRGPGAVGGARPFDLEEGERDGGEDDVMRPALIGAAFEVIEAEVVLELAILLFDGPAAARERDQVDERAWSPGDGAGSTCGRRWPSVRRAASGRRGPPSGARAARRSRAVSGPAVPVPQVTVSHASSGAESASADGGQRCPATPATVKVASPRMATP